MDNADLKLELIPLPNATLQDIGRFANTFQFAYDVDSHDRLNDTHKKHLEQGQCALPNSLNELRACLALEWAILPYVSQRPSAQQEQFLRDLVSKIRDKISLRETG